MAYFLGLPASSLYLCSTHFGCSVGSDWDLTSFIKATLLDELEAGKAEEDHPIALPLTQNLIGALSSMSWLWPRKQRRLLARWLGAGTHEQLVTDEAFVDFTYADLLIRENETF